MSKLYFRRAIALGDKDPLKNLADFALAEGDTGQAIELLQQLLASDRRFVTDFTWEASQRLLRKLLKSRPQRSDQGMPTKLSA